MKRGIAICLSCMLLLCGCNANGNGADELTPGVTPDVTAVTTAEATPEPTPEATPEPTPEPTPTPAPEVSIVMVGEEAMTFIPCLKMSGRRSRRQIWHW